MNVIFVNIDTMRDARMSSNFDGVMSSINVLMDEGFTIQVVQEAVNMKPIKLFQINDFEEFETWVNNGCSSQKQ
jgi:hypothetical protein